MSGPSVSLPSARGRQRVAVTCKTCHCGFFKVAYSLKEWQGNCRSCAMKEMRRRPDVASRIAAAAKRDALANGGVRNARKIYKGFPKELHPRWKGGMPKCPDCGLTLAARVSRRCSLCAKRLLRGPGHWNWKGGITKPNQRERNCPAYRKWRKAVLIRDGHRCVSCGYESCRPRDIIADHILPFVRYKELRFEVSNGRTLCAPCDKKMGWRNTKANRQVA